ncbi:lipoprotein-releasing system ATP-binding protein LolD [Dyadobacter beijingensis]|uniref:Lipoprotein-releasing system ATP-binding protein LolD n=1 Tax=Dyadobacter beijingensis TaxID=365489 RepID=A0ABQ2HV95_9BACT|nr:ABC transporter ATP-binding protein [Dyadobacter beijingensis]GGM90667.1 lipoprotein-releasing system ATP-binding protein LolD [Dyadobacter beijingensis]
MNVLEVANLNKYFNEPVRNQVLKNVGFQVERGEFVAITGKSGCGKSTLLYLLSTMDTDFEGSIMIDGEQMKGKTNRWLAAFRNRHIGFVFQFHYLLPEFTSLENVMLPARKLGEYPVGEIEQRAMQLLKLLNVDGQALKRAGLLSGGQQQRVAISRALINDPLIVMGDEPTGNLDSANGATVFGLFKELAIERKQTVLVVTHDEDFARRADRRIYMADGSILDA